MTKKKKKVTPKKTKKKKKAVKKSAKKIKEQKKLIKTIKNPHRYFKFDVGRYGGEVAMGSITKEQFEFWEGKDDDFAQYMNDRGFDPAEANEKYGVPEAARFDKEFYEYEDICHLSGPEWSEGQTLTIQEVDRDGNALQDDDGNFVEDEQIDLGDLEKKGVKAECIAEHHSGSDSCKDKYYLFGQYFNKGGFTTGVIQTGPDGIDFKKMAIRYENADGFRVFNEIEYDGEMYYLEEDSTGKSSSFYVMEGDDV
jgi:hypothetical protein